MDERMDERGAEIVIVSGWVIQTEVVVFFFTSFVWLGALQRGGVG